MLLLINIQVSRCFDEPVGIPLQIFIHNVVVFPHLFRPEGVLLERFKGLAVNDQLGFVDQLFGQLRPAGVRDVYVQPFGRAFALEARAVR